MEFPDGFKKESCWKPIKDKELLWLELSTGEEKKIGFKTVYEKIGNPSERILEIDIFGKGAVVQIWFIDLKKSPASLQSRILKDGKWIYGLPNLKVDLNGLRMNKKFCGVRISLKVSQEKTETLDIHKM